MTLRDAESSYVQAFRSRSWTETPWWAERDWVGFSIVQALEAMRTIRTATASSLSQRAEFKEDGSPVTAIDRQIELAFRDTLRAFAPDATLVGEEFGGSLPTTGDAVALDPVDGTWAFVTGSGNYATTLAVFRDGQLHTGVIASPTTGEVVYASSGAGTRLLTMPLFDEGESATDLPVYDESQILVVVHPSRSAGQAVHQLYDAWSEGNIRMVRSPGGSPALALAEAAKGRYIYVNLWSKKAAAPYDLAAGVLVVHEAGGAVTGLDGTPVNVLNHSGPFIAGIDRDAMVHVSQLLAAGA
jgi:fructose-1,6-bisphosphatase/inositol monophosphatase family enzyme